ncbi:hypothetical protein [Streptomyces antibioticus]|uniref:hypothetical protein n=1 Tax=Streptomyces antibioticus TaxID=1890 RepID=UPI003D749531
MSTPTPHERLADSGELPGAALLDSPTDAPCPLTSDLIRQRLTDALTANWPRMAHADHAREVADTLTNILLPIVSRSRNESSSWLRKAVQAVAQRNRARATAATLEQMSAEAARLLRAGLPGQALAVLESDGRPLGPCAAPGLLDDMAPCARPVGHGGAHSDDPLYVDPPDEEARLPERMFVVVTVRRCIGGDFPVLDLHGVYPLVEDANGRACDLALKLSAADPIEVTSSGDGSVSLAVPPSGSFTGLIEVVELEVDPYASQAARDAEYEAAREDAYDPDYGRDLDDEE